MLDSGSLLGDTTRIISYINYAHCTAAHQSGHADDHANHYTYTSHADLYIYTHHDRRQTFTTETITPTETVTPTMDLSGNGHTYKRNRHARPNMTGTATQKYGGFASVFISVDTIYYGICEPTETIITASVQDTQNVTNMVAFFRLVDKVTLKVTIGTRPSPCRIKAAGLSRLP